MMLAKTMRQASQKPAIARPGRAGDDERAVPSDNPARAKPGIVIGDIGPIGAPFTCAAIGMPMWAASRRMPIQDRQNSSRAARAPVDPITIPIRYAPRLRGERALKKTAVP